ncbi:MAG: TAXI family TRAP transporter solute-binding subunit [Caldisericia bacterium]
MRLNKILVGFLIVALVVTIFVGCSKKSETKPPEETTKSYSFKMPSGSPTGTYYITLTAIAGVVSKYEPNIVAVAVPGGGSAANCRSVGKGESLMSMTTSMVAYQAFTGTGSFQNEKYENLRSVGPAHPLIISFIVRANSNIKTVYDLKGKRIAIGEAGSGDAVAAEEILRTAGLWDSVVKVNVGDPDSWDMLKSGAVDAAIHHTTVPNSNLYQFSTSTPITLTEIPEELADKVISNSPYFFKYIAKKDSYVGMGNDVKVIANPSILITNKDADEDMVYKFVKAYWDHFDEVVASAKFLTTVNVNDPLSGISIPLHPGAYKYWVEKGVNVPDHIKPK